MMLRCTAVVVAVMCLAASCTGGQTCVPRHIELDDRHIAMSSKDLKYQTDDIHYRNCSTVPVPESRRYVGWYPDPTQLPSEYRIQVNLPQVMAVHSIVFQKTWTQCPDGVHDFSNDAYLQTFDVKYAMPGDVSKVFVDYAQNVVALKPNTIENEVTFQEPVVTSILTIIPRLNSLYPCFRFKLMGCAPDDMCSANWCMNGAQCTGQNICSCTPGFFGNRCNETVENLEQQDYTFTQIVNNQLDTPAALFDVVGDGISIVDDPTRKRSHHHGHHNSCHFSGSSHCHLQYNHHNSHHHHNNNHNNQGSHMTSHCMNNLHNNHHGFTTHMNVHFGHNHHGHNGHTYLFSNGGNLASHSGSCLSHHNNHLHFQVSTQTHSWHVSHPCNLHTNQWHSIATSWHPHTGAHISINNILVASSNVKNPCNACTSTKPLVIGGGHTNTNVNVNVNININLNMSINNLLMYNTTMTSLQNLGYSGPLTPPPPTTTPAPTTTPVPTTTPIPTTPPPTTTTVKPITTTAAKTTTATTTPTTTTSAPLSPQCFNYNQQPAIGASNSSTRCQVGEVCVLYEEHNLYTAKCLDKQLCLSGKRLASGHCWICCDSYLCNDHCSASTAKQCKDDPGCATLSSTGFDVCSDSQISVNLCAKTCGVC